MSKSDDYKTDLETLQIELVKAQVWSMKTGVKLLVALEGRDAAGKDGAIRRITEHLSPRATRVAALPKPSDRETGQWYFQRYAAHLPTHGEWVLFNRSWYNRAGVEPVMGFCTPEQHEQFLRDAPQFEAMLLSSGIKLVKIWLDIGKDEQAERLEARRKEPLKLLKTSPLDAEAQKRWDDYSAARNEMLRRTHTEHAPWYCVRANHKKAARLNIIRLILDQLDDPGTAKKTRKWDPAVVFPFEEAAITDGRLAK
jgi:polyphosphate kinase 2